MVDMMMNSGNQPEAAAGGRLARLLSFLESDPDNLALLSDAAEAAVAERAPAVALDLLSRHAAIAPLSPGQANLAGLAALQAGDSRAAAARFAALVDAGVADPAVRFNLAWSLAKEKDLSAALALLDEALASALPQAAMLRLQLLHDQGEVDAAMAEAGRYLRLHPDHSGLLAAVSVLALDAEDEALARSCAGRAGDHPDALATLGMLALGDSRVAEARELFDRVLARDGDKARGLVGRGLAKLLTDEPGSAALDLDRGAALFGDHLGSWIAAGWAHFINRDPQASRARFETALELDPTFAETHGSLAVLDLLAGDAERAAERCDIALRLDRNCYSGALARSLLAAHSGDREGSQRIFELALATPVDGSDRTIGQALASLGFR